MVAHGTRGQLTIGAIIRRWLAVSTGAVIAVGSVPTVATATFPGRNGRIAYVSGIPGVVRTINPDGSGDRKVLPDVYEPRWSPTGRRLVFVDANSEHVTSARADGSRVQSLITPAEHRSQVGVGDYLGDATWSPGGRRIAYAAWWEASEDEPARPVVYTARRDGSDVRRIHAGEGPAWSARGNVIAFLTPANSIATIRASGTGYRTLVRRNPRQYRFDLDVSPDGRRLLYQQLDLTATSYKNRIGVIDLKDGGPRLLSPQAVSAAVWSPRGKRIAYASRYDAVIRTIRPDGTRIRELLALPTSVDWLSWAPR